MKVALVFAAIVSLGACDTHLLEGVSITGLNQTLSMVLYRGVRTDGLYRLVLRPVAKGIVSINSMAWMITQAVLLQKPNSFLYV